MALSLESAGMRTPLELLYKCPVSYQHLLTEMKKLSTNRRFVESWFARSHRRCKPLKPFEKCCAEAGTQHLAWKMTDGLLMVSPFSHLLRRNVFRLAFSRFAELVATAIFCRAHKPTVQNQLRPRAHHDS